MPKVAVLNQEGKNVGEVALADAGFGVKPAAAFVHSVVVAEQANRRRPYASPKTRGEVRGGGKKPWKQKGTGRARQGSIRSPQWVGGGIAFGPRKERNYAVKINKKAKRKALFMALSDKLAEKKLVVIDQLSSEPAKTKLLAGVMKNLPLEKTALVILPASNPLVVRMARNLSNVKVVTANSVNLLDVLAYRSLVFLKDAVPAFEKIYA